jgi:hypothetical protein
MRTPPAPRRARLAAKAPRRHHVLAEIGDAEQAGIALEHARLRRRERRRGEQLHLASEFSPSCSVIA